MRLPPVGVTPLPTFVLASPTSKTSQSSGITPTSVCLYPTGTAGFSATNSYPGDTSCTPTSLLMPSVLPSFSDVHPLWPTEYLPAESAPVVAWHNGQPAGARGR